jgi:hypothetical protein
MSEPFIRFFYTWSHRVKLLNDNIRDIFLIIASYTLLLSHSTNYQPTPLPPSSIPNFECSSPTSIFLTIHLDSGHDIIHSVLNTQFILADGLATYTLTFRIYMTSCIP